MLGMFAINVVAPIIIGNTSEKEGYIKLIVIVTIIVVAFSVIGTLGLKERVQAEPGKDQYGIKDLFRILGQRPVAVTFLSSLLYMVGVFVANTALAYFFTYVIGNLALISVVSMVELIALLPATIIVGMLINKIGKKKAYVIGLIVMGAVPLIRLIDVANIPILMAATAIAGFASGLCTPLTYGIQADNTDYIELKMGYRAEAAVAALSSFITKCGMGIGGAVPGYLLAAVGFDATAQNQPAEVRGILIASAIVIPAILYVAGALIFGIGYPLTKEKLLKQAEEIGALREKTDDKA